MARYWQLLLLAALALFGAGYAYSNHRWAQARTEGLAKALALDSIVTRFRVDSVTQAVALQQEIDRVTAAEQLTRQAVGQRLVAIRNLRELQRQNDRLIAHASDTNFTQAESASMVGPLLVERAALQAVVAADSVVIAAQDSSLTIERSLSAGYRAQWLTAEAKATALDHANGELKKVCFTPKPLLSQPAFRISATALLALGVVLLTR